MGLDRGYQRIKGTHATSQATIKGSVVNVENLEPVRHRTSLAADSDEHGISSVSLLHCGSSPAAILWRIGAAWINAVHRVFGRGPWSHIRFEREEVVAPAVAHGYPERAISLIGRVRGNMAAIIDASPGHIKRMIGKPVRCSQRAAITAAGKRAATAKVGCGNGNANPAVAQTCAPRNWLRIRFRCATKLLQNCEPPKSLPNEIDSFHAHPHRKYSIDVIVSQ